MFVLEAAETYTFDKDIKPLLNSYPCAGCHDFVNTYSSLITAKSELQPTQNIPIIYPSKPDSSVLIWRLEGKLPSGVSLTSMPFGSDKLSITDIQKFRDWIMLGAPENTVGVNEISIWGEIKQLFK